MRVCSLRPGPVIRAALASLLLSGCQSNELVKRQPAAGLNGSFEVTEAGFPVNWAFFPNPETDSTLLVHLDSEFVRDGDHSLRLRVRAGERLPGIRSTQVPLHAGRDYRLSISFRNEGCHLEVNRIVQDASGKTNLRRDVIVDTHASSTQWETFEETLSLTADEAQVLLVFLIDGSGTVWFDAVKLEALEA